MINHHAQMARRLGEQLGLSAEVLDALVRAYEQWDGHAATLSAPRRVTQAVPISRRRRR